MDRLDIRRRLDRQRRLAALMDVAAPLGREVLRLKGLLGRGKQRAHRHDRGVLLLSGRRAQCSCAGRFVLKGDLQVRQGQDAVTRVGDREAAAGSADLVVHLGGGADLLTIRANNHRRGHTAGSFCADLDACDVGITRDGKRDRLTGGQIDLVVRATVLIVGDVRCCSAVDEESCLYIISHQRVMQLDVLRVTLAVLRVVTLILAHGVIDADGIEPEAVGIIARVIEELTVADLDLDGIRVIIQTGDLDHRDLVERLRAVSRHTGGIAIVAVVRVARADLHFFSLGIRHGVHDRAGGVAGQGDDIKASALEGEGRSGHLTELTGVGIDRDLGGAAHGEGAAFGIGRVIAVDVVALALELLKDLLLRRILLADGRPVAVFLVLIDNVRAIGIRKRGEAVLIVDARRGDDVDGEDRRLLSRIIRKLDKERDRRRAVKRIVERIRHRLIVAVDLRSAVLARILKRLLTGKQ